MPGIRFVASLAALLLVAFVMVEPAGAAPAAAVWTPSTSGPDSRAFRCAGTWSPIQALVSGFVVGNCRGGTTVRGIATDECAPGCRRGAASEGRGWAAVSLPNSAHFAGCGWMNVKNRLALGGSPPADRCNAVSGPDRPFLGSFVKRFAGRRLDGARAPTSEKYAGLWVWAGRFTSGANKGREGGGQEYRPRFRDAAKTCPAYANINPWLPWQQVRASERMWSVHDGSPHVTIRYVAKFRIADEQGRMGWWVNVHSSAPADRSAPWGFIAASCLFDAQRSAAKAGRRSARSVRGTGHRQRPVAAAKCGFSAVPFHEIVARKNMTCDEAKSVLRDLRGDHALAPIACHAPRDVRGWHLRNLVHDPSLGITRFSATGRSLDFARHQFPGQIWCPA